MICTIRVKPDEKLKNWQNELLVLLCEMETLPFENLNELFPKFCELPCILLWVLVLLFCAQLVPAKNMEMAMPKTIWRIFMTWASWRGC